MASDEDSIEQRLPGYRYGIVLVLVFVTYVFMAAGFEGAWTRPVTVALQGATLLVALTASKVGRRLLRIATIVVAIAFVGALVSVASDREGIRASFLILNFLLVGTAPVVIAVSVIRRRVVDVKTVLGALCIYVLIGMAFAFAYAAMGQIMDVPFFAQTSNASTADYLYFSFVTLTTVGYGDFTAAEGLGRATASIEALFGQLYLVTIVALVVSRMAMAAPRQRAAAKAKTTTKTARQA
jgi:hypothetical protein